MRRIGLGIVLSIVFLVLALRGQDYAALVAALRSASYGWLLPAVAVYFVGVVLRAIRWSILLSPVRSLSWRQLLPAVSVGYMANNVLPFRTGEIVRAYAVGRQFGVSKTATLATIVLERLLDGLTMLGFIVVAATAVALDSALQRVALVATVLFLPAFGLLIVAARSSRLLSLVLWLLRYMPAALRARVERMVRSGFSGVAVFRNSSALVQAIGLSVAAWLAEAAMYALVARAFALDLSLVLILLTTAVANLATLIPSSPGYIGPFEAGVLLVLAGVAGVPRPLAFSYAIVLHAALYLPITLVGLAFWSKLQLDWAVLRRARTEEVVPS
ncbi:lysylphosphatidylglycerol synthase transmembrane domain-containing protein [Thermomicrobium sp. 4228-Ro]|uniref:lysylphosphatidylglycerol synthase transmembrane domain-containing protein n=1 Tax=Thermomicrobium sp. 4228-Ro TaxID=2993937 RepID=UPI0022496AA3|nr:lysylphosphatidylglycerol synthase transmembrane domain-containing protein [Thermomicrobium sp. 4228-Ro]MCX2726370.1 lysylphosphatidylglycerol synthase transmembrane domain-containing protein [Thermomicrobium sp. 4228-Ro]